MGHTSQTRQTEDIIVKSTWDNYREIFCCVLENIFGKPLWGSDKSQMAGNLTCKTTLGSYEA